MISHEFDTCYQNSVRVNNCASAKKKKKKKLCTTMSSSISLNTVYQAIKSSMRILYQHCTNKEPCLQGLSAEFRQPSVYQPSGADTIVSPVRGLFSLFSLSLFSTETPSHAFDQNIEISTTCPLSLAPLESDPGLA